MISEPKRTTLSQITTVFFTCPTTLNVKLDVLLITPSVRKFTMKPKNAARRYIPGLARILARPFSVANALNSKIKMPSVRKNRLAGAMMYKPSMSSNRRFPAAQSPSSTLTHPTVRNMVKRLPPALTPQSF